MAKVDYKIIGKVIDGSYNPIPEASIVSNGGDIATSEPNGDFSLIGLRDKGEIFSIIISSPDFGTKNVIPFDLKGNIKNNLLNLINHLK